MILSKAKSLILVLCACAAITAKAQDIMISSAAFDHAMRSVEMISIDGGCSHNSDGLSGIPSENLYGNNWTNTGAHARGVALPDSFRIDMRGFHMPCANRIVTSTFAPRWGRYHKGLDISLHVGDTIRAAFNGKIRVVSYEAAGYGNFVVIRHANGLETVYGHMSKHLVAANQYVRAGEPIGLGGSTGRSTGPHLHFETRIAGVAFSPALLFDFANQTATCESYLFRKATYMKESAAVAQTTGKPYRKASDNVTPVVEQAPAVQLASNNDAQNNTTAQTTRPATRQSSRRSAGPSAPHLYTVRDGETLNDIAERNNVSLELLCKTNNMSRTALVNGGQVVLIP